MNKKHLFLLAVFTVFTAISVNADDGIEWRIPRYYDEFSGRWGGLYTLDIEEDIDAMIPKSHIDVSVLMEHKNLSEVENLIYISIIFDMDSFFNDFLDIPDIKRLNIPKDFLWSLFVNDFHSANPQFAENASFGEYYIILDFIENIENFTWNNSSGEMYMSRDGRIVKLVLYQSISLGLGGEGFNEVYLYRY